MEDSTPAVQLEDFVTIAPGTPNVPKTQAHLVWRVDFLRTRQSDGVRMASLHSYADGWKTMLGARRVDIIPVSALRLAADPR
jgi:hypothetical protein